jgi:hypothetical protein
MLLVTMFIIGHMEIGGGYCRTDMMLYDNPITMEYPCEYYSTFLELEEELQKELQKLNQLEV